MRSLLVITAALFSVEAVGCIKKPCNQAIYDSIYRKTLEKAIRSDLSHKAFTERNDVIRVLRELCLGQQSTWEKEFKPRRKDGYRD